MNRDNALPLALLALYVVVWTLCAIKPLYPSDWLLENVLVFVFVPVVVIHYFRGARLSNTAYVTLFIFLSLHSLGSHYTYAEVPYDDWWYALTGSTLNDTMGWSRNHYDRLVHFSYGLLTTPIWVEILRRALPDMRSFWRWLIPLTFMMSHSLMYELIEWAAAMQFGGELGEAYLGTQGDNWDAQQDMMLASLGSVICLALLAAAGRLGDPPLSRPAVS